MSQNSSKISRRQFGLGAAALGASAVGLSPLRAFARNSLDLGSMRIDTLSDGYLTQGGDSVFGAMPQDALAPILQEYGVDRDLPQPVCNVTLLRDDQRTILFDVGSGTEFVPTAGTLLDSMDELGVSPEDVTHVVITHAHADHIWGLLDDFDDPLFPDATFMMGRKEWDYWYDSDTVDTIAESRTFMAVGAKRRMEVIEQSVVLFEDGEEILPGVMARATFGHTPGHMAFELNSGANSAMVVGDAIPDHHVSFARPDWHTGRDQDMELGAKSRVSILDQVSGQKMPLIAFHVPDGGIGYAEKYADGYRFVPD